MKEAECQRMGKVVDTPEDRRDGRDSKRDTTE